MIKILANVRLAVRETQPGDLLLFPERALSGYLPDMEPLREIDSRRVLENLTIIKNIAIEHKIHVWIGACYKQANNWVNAAHGYAPDGQDYVYHKINLAVHERGVMIPGSKLPVFRVGTAAGEINVGVQICREIRFPEQWAYLARNGADLILHLNNAVGDQSVQSVWRSHLISRAAETQRFVLSSNAADQLQKCPTMAIDPAGNVMEEIVSDDFASFRVRLDISQVSAWYLDQARTDILPIGR